MGARPSSFKTEEKPTVPTKVWSEQQRAIFDWFEKPAPLLSEEESAAVDNEGANLVVRARAGTGKTTTIVEGVNRAPEESILLCAFNKKIAEELNSRLANRGVAEAKTLHAIGYAAIRRQWRGMPVSSGSVRADSLTDKVCEPNTPKQIKRLISLLHTKARDMQPIACSTETLTSLAYFFDYVPDEGWGQYDLDFVVEAAHAAMHVAAAEDPTYDIGIDYADMIYLPLVWNLLVPTYDLVVVDEAQDLTLAQLTMAQRVCNGRICVVGDDKQAIYAFRGADTRSIDRLKRELCAVELPLTTTYRCGQSIVRKAQTLVPDIQAGETNPEGIVDEGTETVMLDSARPGQFILSRLNAPLVSLTLRLLQKGLRARMAGRDIGAGITAVLNRLRVVNSTPVDDLLDRLQKWESKQTTRLAACGQIALVDRVRDQAAMIRALCEDEEVAGGVIQRCGWLFEDVPGEETITCSSVHKAKGLEADRVYILVDTLYRRGVSEEEQNIEYVAITRAKSHLTLVRGVA